MRSVIVVGAAFGPGTTAQSGAAYLFVRDESVWHQQAKLIAADGLAFDFFGSVVSVSGHTVAVGASSHSLSTPNVPSAGAVYVLRLSDNGGVWKQIAEIFAKRHSPFMQLHSSCSPTA